MVIWWLQEVMITWWPYMILGRVRSCINLISILLQLRHWPGHPIRTIFCPQVVDLLINQYEYGMWMRIDAWIKLILVHKSVIWCTQSIPTNLSPLMGIPWMLSTCGTAGIWRKLAHYEGIAIGCCTWPDPLMVRVFWPGQEIRHWDFGKFSPAQPAYTIGSACSNPRTLTYVDNWWYLIFYFIHLLYLSIYSCLF